MPWTTVYMYIVDKFSFLGHGALKMLVIILQYDIELVWGLY